MSIPKSVASSKIFAEFSQEEQLHFFEIKEKCVRSHIDTLYYSVCLMGDRPEAKDPAEDQGYRNPNINKLVVDLDLLRDRVRKDWNAELDFMGLAVEPTGFSLYAYHLSLPEMFDIFIAKSIPTSETPRIVVQLRTRALIQWGSYEAVKRSFEYVTKILAEYKLSAWQVGINRVDYAYHTNLIQDANRYFNDKQLAHHLKSSFRKGNKYFGIGENIDIETLSLGNRKSNCIFFRAYDKSREVIQEAYKAYFIERWYKLGLISEYDRYVYQYAYERASFATGILVGRMAWYLEYGHDDDLKERFRDLMKKYHIDSDNNEKLEKELRGVLPKNTVVFNIEFQTKRKFYNEIARDVADWECHIPKEYQNEPQLRPIYATIALRARIQEYLTTETVAFVKDRKNPKNPDTEEIEYLDWWKRIRSCEIEGVDSDELLTRQRDIGADIKKTVQKIKNSVAHLQILRRRSVDARSFHEDISDTLCYLNDNDFYGFAPKDDGSAFEFSDKGYQDIRRRKARQDRGLLASLQSKEEVESFISQTAKTLQNSYVATVDEKTGELKLKKNNESKEEKKNENNEC